MCRFDRPAARRAALLSACALCALAHGGPLSAAVTWTGAAGSNWATAGSWLNGLQPTPTETVNFNDSGSTNVPNDPTSLLNTSRTIGGLSFNNTAAKYHTLDLGGHTLTIAGNLNFNSDQGAPTTTTLRNGALSFSGPFANLHVARSFSANANAIADFTGLAAFNATLQELTVAYSSSVLATGTLLLAPSNSLSVNRLFVGASNNSADTNGTLRFGLSNTLLANEITVAKDNSAGLVTIATGGTLALGSPSQRARLHIANQLVNSNATYNGKIDLAGSTLNGYLSDFVVGQREGTGGGAAGGTFIGGNGGTLHVGALGNTATMYIGRNLGSGIASGTVNLASMGTLTANLQSLVVGASQTSIGVGTLSLPAHSHIDALSISVGAGNGTGTVNLGASNTLETGALIIGQDYANGTVTMPAGGSLALGSLARPASLRIAVASINSNTSYTGKLEVTGGTFSGVLANLIVGYREGPAGGGSALGYLYGGNAGSLTIGSAGSPGDIIIGRTVSSGASTGIVNLQGQSSLNATLNSLLVGTTLSSFSYGLLNLPASNTITASTIVVGGGTGSNGTLALGQNNTILTPQFTVSNHYSNGTVTIPAGGTLTLGAPGQRTALTLASGALLSNDQFTGRVDLSNATFTAYLSSLTVGQRDGTGGGGGMLGQLVGGNAGAVDIGAPGNTANVYIGRTLSSGGSTGTVDFSGQTSITASLNTLAIGTGVGGAVRGALSLGRNNFISANAILVGVGTSDGAGTLTLGKNNTIFTNQLTLAQDYASAVVNIVAGGTLTLGSPSQRANLTMATGNTNTNATYQATFDLTGARVSVYFDDIIIGLKNDEPGGEVGTFTIGNDPNNYIEANTIALGGTRSTGTINYAGGSFFAGAITGGAGTANFNWTGGRLSVGTFGSAARLFHLANTGSGTLAPGNPDGMVGSTTIYGNYTQAASAAMALRIAGNTPGTGNDLVLISGSATLAGRLTLSTLNDFAPALSENYLLASYGSRSGAFAFVAPPQMPQNVAFVLDYATVPTQLWMRTVVPTLQSWTAGNGNLGVAGNWNTNSIPTTASTLFIGNATVTPRTVSIAASTTVHRIELAGTTSTVTLEVPAGVQLGVANQLVVGANASLIGGGQVFGNVLVAGGGLVAAQSLASPLVLAGITTSSGTLQAAGGALSINGPATLGGTVQALGGTLNFNSTGIVITAPMSLTSGTANFNTAGISAAAITGTGTLNVAAGASLTSDGVVVSTLNVNGTHTLRANGGPTGASKISTLTIAGSTGNWSGKLDLADNALVVQTAGGAAKAAAIAALQNQIASGRAGGTWTGTGITSSSIVPDTTLALIDNADLQLLSFRGLLLNSASLVVVQARLGDATLDKVVDAFDLNLLASHWQQSGVWSAGDFTADGLVDAFDLNVLAAHWQSGTAGSLEAALAAYPQFAGVPVPEPASLLLLTPLLALLHRRRRP